MWAQTVTIDPRELGDGPVFDDGRAPDLVLTFSNTQQAKASGVFQSVANAFPEARHLACSTGTTVAGELLEDEGVTLMGLGFDATDVRTAMAQIKDHEGSAEIGAALGAQLADPELAGVFVLADGLGVNGSELVAGLTRVVGEQVAISGGLAGDGDRFAETLVALGGETIEGGVIAVGFYGRQIQFSHGSVGGWDQFGPQRKITRAEGNVLYELDGEPALALYERYLGDEAEGLPASALLFPLKLWDPEDPENSVVRTVLSIDRDAQSMTFAGDVPEGWHAKLMRGSFSRLVSGAADAATHAMSRLEALGAEAQACLFVSCVGRRLLMKQRTEDEAAAVNDVLGRKVPIAGFYSYGELAPHNATGACGLHNQTVTLTLLSEKVA